MANYAIEGPMKGMEAPAVNPYMGEGGAQELSEDERRLLRRIEERSDNSQLYGLKYHVNRRGFLDLAYFNGFQHTYWDRRHHRLAQVPVVDDRSQLTDNKILPACVHAISLLTHKINFKLRPKGSDFRAKREARMGERAMNHLYRTNRWKGKVMKAMEWCVITGCGFIRPFWNPHIGARRKQYLDPRDRQPIPEEMLNDRLRAALEREGLVAEYRQGDIDLSVHSLFEVYVPDMATDVESLPWYLMTYRKPLSWIRRAFPERGDMVQAETFSWWERNTFEARILGMAGGAAEGHFGTMAGASGNVSYTDQESAIVKVYVEPPSPDNPKGCNAVVANGVLLEKTDSQQHIFGLNGPDLFKFDFIQRPGSFWPISLPENMISPQREHNASRSQISDLRRSMLKPRILSPRGAALAKSALSSRSVEVLEYDDKKAPPSWQPFPDVPPSLFAMMDSDSMTMRDLSAQHEATQGQNPSGSRAGYMITLLQEQDLKFYRPIVERNAESFEGLWGAVHQMVKRTWTQKRYIEELSDQELVWAGEIGAEDLAEDAKVIVDVESMLPKSRAAQQAFAESFMQYGVNLNIYPRLVQAAILEALELGDASQIKEIYEADKRWAEAAIETMIGDHDKGVEGRDVAVRPGIDDHEVQLQVVRHFQKSAAYDSLPPDAKSRIERFAQNHTTALVEGIAAQAAFFGGGGEQSSSQGGGGNGQPQGAQSGKPEEAVR